MKITILVYGWYFHQNVGDELFKDAFINLFPEFNFLFVNNITAKSLDNVNAVFFGGGSILESKPSIDEQAFKLLQNKKIFYIGVGAETSINPTHELLMKQAKLIAIRSAEQFEKVKRINANTICIPDLVYSLQDSVKLDPKKSKSVLILPNIMLVPYWDDPQWKSASWEYFKSEFAQFLDSLIDKDYILNFFSMCENEKLNDRWAAVEIINRMKNRDQSHLILNHFNDIKNISEIFSQYSAIITQRYHGIVLSEMIKTPCLSIHHHDKLKNAKLKYGSSMSFYGASKANLIDNFNNIINLKLSNNLDSKTSLFKELQDIVNSFDF